MQKTLSIFIYLILLLGFVLSKPLVSQEIRKEGRYFVAEINKEMNVKPGGSLRIYDIRGDVKVNVWGKNKVSIREIKKMDVFTDEEARTALEKSKSEYRYHDNIVEISGETFSRNWIISRFNITVPKSFNVDVTTRAGDITILGAGGEVSLRTSGGDIILRNIEGVVEARTSGGDIEVTNSKNRVNIKTSGGDIELRNIGGPVNAKTSGGDVKIVGATGDIELTTSGGDIEIFEVEGKVIARTSGGDLEIENTSGPVTAQTSGGDIRFRKIDGRLIVSTSGGDIKGRTVLSNCEVSTAGGSIQLRDVQGGVKAKTAGGDITVEVTLKDFSKEHYVDLRTASGDITLFIPEKLPASINAEIKITDRWEDYNIYSDFPLKVSDGPGAQKRHWGSKTLRARGDINGGGDPIELYTTNGDIHIKKLK
ncbi:MAG: hypothetical protein D6813_05330 [Calditrichaeota bacterium]|nr:MAG: hypothetical protein D6813_05330 [Calditrichota bacterium]